MKDHREKSQTERDVDKTRIRGLSQILNSHLHSYIPDETHLVCHTRDCTESITEHYCLNNVSGSCKELEETQGKIYVENLLRHPYFNLGFKFLISTKRKKVNKQIFIYV